MKCSGQFHEIADMVRRKREGYTMQQIQKHLPQNVSTQVFAGGVVLVGPTLDTPSYQQIMAAIPERLKEAVIGWKQVSRPLQGGTP